MKTKLWAIVGASMMAASALAYTAEHSAPVPPPSDRLVIVRTASTPADPTPAAAPRVAPTAATRAAPWQPRITDTWQWQLSGKVNTSYDVAVYDVDLFDTPTATLDQLHAAGRRIICYFSAGSSENWRADYDQFTAADQGKPLDGWAGEKWLDVRSANVRRIMGARLDLAKTRGCDAVEPDNVDGYSNANGLGLTAADQLDYNRFLADAARTRGLAVGLKNDLAQVKTLAPAFDFAVNEQCAQYRECDKLAPFTAAGKPVFNAEYAAKYRNDANGARAQLCQASRAANIRTLVLPLKLNDAYRYSCD